MYLISFTLKLPWIVKQLQEGRPFTLWTDVSTCSPAFSGLIYAPYVLMLRDWHSRPYGLVPNWVPTSCPENIDNDQELTPEAEIVNVRFTKSVIASKAAFTYEEAQLRKDDRYVIFVSSFLWFGRLLANLTPLLPHPAPCITPTGCHPQSYFHAVTMQCAKR